MAVVVPVFVDTTVLLGGYIDLGPKSIDSQRVLDAVADGLVSDARTAWHCCLEFYSVATRLPAGYRISPRQACVLLQEILGSFRLEQLPADARTCFLESCVEERVAGGRIYDAHIAEIARLGGAQLVVTDNQRHFSTLLRHGVRVLRPAEFLSELQQEPRRTS
jgi:hypothetical protein